MRRHTEFRKAVHVFGANLDFHRATFRADDDGMQGLVAIGLGIGDVVVEFLGNMQPGAVNQAEDRVAGRDILDDDAHGMKVIEGLQRNVLALDFLVNAVDVLGSAEDAPRDAGRFQLFFQVMDKVLNKALAFGPVAGQ